jgi:hypothetical protein
MLRRKVAKQKGGEVVGTYEKLPNEFLSWSDKKQKKYIKELMKSFSPGPLPGSSSSDKAQ